MQVQTFQDWSEALMASVANALTVLANAIPRVIGFILILLVGWILARLLGRATRALLGRVRFDELAGRARFNELTRKLDAETDASALVGSIVKWIILFATLLVAFEALGLPEISSLFEALLLWIPNLIVAVAVLFLAGLAAGPLGTLVRGAAAEADFSDPDALARAARIALWVFALIIALAQLGIAENLIYALFYGFVAAVALAFGLGGRKTAAKVVERWYTAAERRRGSTKAPGSPGPGPQGAP